MDPQKVVEHIVVVLKNGITYCPADFTLADIRREYPTAKICYREWSTPNGGRWQRGRDIKIKR